MEKMNFLAGVSCVYDEKRDIQEVEQGLAVDINQALKTGIVRDTGAPMDSNGIESPEQIVGRVENIFDAIESSRVIKKFGKKAAPVVTPSAPSAPAAPAASAAPAAPSASAAPANP